MLTLIHLTARTCDGSQNGSFVQHGKEPVVLSPARTQAHIITSGMNRILLGFALVFPACLFSQTEPARPAFAVTSVKPSHTNCCVSGGVGNGGSVNRNVTVKMLIVTAYRIQEFQISGGPAWIASERFDVEGKADDPKADFDQLRLMLQSLLEDRFSLKVHRETKETAVYALVIGKKGLKIRPSADQTSPDVNGPTPPGSTGPNHGAFRFGPGSMIGNAVTLSLFSRFLSQRLDRVVIDRTNLAGRFDIHLQWTPDNGENPSSSHTSYIAQSGESGPSIFTAVREQLGLRLEPAKGAVELLVIDHVESPTAN